MLSPGICKLTTLFILSSVQLAHAQFFEYPEWSIEATASVFQGQGVTDSRGPTTRPYGLSDLVLVQQGPNPRVAQAYADPLNIVARMASTASATATVSADARSTFKINITGDESMPSTVGPREVHAHFIVERNIDITDSGSSFASGRSDASMDLKSEFGGDRSTLGGTEWYSYLWFPTPEGFGHTESGIYETIPDARGYQQVEIILPITIDTFPGTEVVTVDARTSVSGFAQGDAVAESSLKIQIPAAPLRPGEVRPILPQLVPDISGSAFTIGPLNPIPITLPSVSGFRPEGSLLGMVDSLPPAFLTLPDGTPLEDVGYSVVYTSIAVPEPNTLCMSVLALLTLARFKRR